MLFCFCCLTERDLAIQGNILWTGAYLFKTLGISLLFGGGMGAVLCFFICKGAVRKVSGQDSARAEERDTFLGGNRWGRVFGLSMGLTFAAWIPAFLAYYPAI